MKFRLHSDRFKIDCSISFIYYFGIEYYIHCNNIEISSISLKCFSKYTTWLGNGIADSRKRSLIIVYCLFVFVECYNIVPQHADLCSRAGPQIVGRFKVMSAPLNFSVTAVLEKVV